jgi:hypothetical protein
VDWLFTVDRIESMESSESDQWSRIWGRWRESLVKLPGGRACNCNSYGELLLSLSVAVLWIVVVVPCGDRVDGI